MQPYIIKQGDYLALLAFKFGFDADTVWNDPANADLQKLRPDPNMLCATDVLYIPDQVSKPPVTQSVTTGTANTFVTNPPTVNVSLKFTDAQFASQAYTINELPELTGLTTQADGTTGFAVPVSQGTVTLVFTGDGTTFTCSIGWLDPITTISGIVQRLQNLGYLDPAGSFGLSTLDVIRAALQTFRSAQPGAAPASDPSPASASPPSNANPTPSSPAPVSAPPSGPPPSSGSKPPPSSTAPGSSPPPSSPPPSSASSPPPSSAPPSSEAPPSSAPPLSNPPPSSAPPSSDPPQSSAPPSSSRAPSVPPASAPQSNGGAPPSSGPASTSSSQADNAGLSDNGTLDDATTQLLLTAHGS